jgi:hypothetical protein
MKVDVDFLNPAITGIRQQWQHLPEPVRDVMPYAGAAAAQRKPRSNSLNNSSSCS